MNAPYADAAHRYLEAGWSPIPVGKRPCEKTPPPVGFTGEDGRSPTPEDVAGWVRQRGDRNVGLRLPPGVVGVDVDAYDDKPGAATMAAGEGAHGPLPATWWSTSRTDGSGIRYYLWTADINPVGGLPGVETIHHGHRYAVVAPSVHPEGRGYRWIRPDGSDAGPDEVPKPGDLPPMPVGWVRHWTKKCECFATNHANGSGLRLQVKSGDPIMDQVDQWRRDLTSGLSRHDGTVPRVMALVGFAKGGWPGADQALDTIRGEYLDLVAGDRGGPRTAAAEWDRMVEGADRKATATRYQPPAHTWEPPRPTADSNDDEQPKKRPALEFTSIGDLAAKVDADGPRNFLIRGVWPQGAYGVLGGDAKAGKTWLALDLAVSVASGEPWLGHLPVDHPGTVVVFAGEGGAAGIVRRLRAIAVHRGVTLEGLPIEVCTRAPHLGNSEHLEAFATHSYRTRPALVVLDPLYLAVGSAATGQTLSLMGELLERAQLICERAGASLFVVHHHNRAGGLSGAGPEEWGRVLISAKVKASSTDPVTKATTVLTAMEVRGGEIPDQAFRTKRTISTDDPDDLNSALRYDVDVVTDEPGTVSVTDPGMPPARRKLLHAIRDLDRPVTNQEIVDRVAADHGHGLKRPTVSKELNTLLADGHLDAVSSPGRPTYWTIRGVSNGPPEDDLKVTPLADTPNVSARRGRDDEAWAF